MSSTEAPRVSVVIRSFKRLSALAELLELILAQEHDSFEVVIVEQTPEPTAEELERLAPLVADPRVNLLKRPPLGGPAARNEGVRHSRGDVVLLIDDDDLPLVPDWIAAHDRAYQADPTLVGLSARMVREADEPCPYPDAMRPFIRRRCMSYSVLKTPYTYARFDEDVTHVDWLHGSNASFRREFGLKVGLWDTTVRSSDEHSFALRAQKAMEPGQHFGYVAYPPALQRLDIRGGMDKRFVTARAELVNNLRYVHRIVGAYHPWRLRAAYPAYLAWTMVKTSNWVWDPGRRHLSRGQRLKLMMDIVRDLPGAVRQIRSEQAEA